MFRNAFPALLVVLSLVLAACGGDDTSGLGNTSVTEGCTTEDQNEAVYAIMNDWYYWYRQVPDVNPANYESPEALLEAIRYEPLDKTFTYLTTVEEEEAYLSNAAYVGYGFSTLVSGSELYLRESFPGGPAYQAGMRRGDRILSVNGESVATLLAAGTLGDAFGPSEAGFTAEFQVEHPDGSTDVYEVAKAEVTTPVTSDLATDLSAGNDTSYLFFRSFVNPAYDRLDDAFAQIAAANDTRLVLDLRYNGGGLVDVAEHLAGLLAGEDDEGKLLGTMQFNDRHSDQNIQLIIETLQSSANISDLVIITTASTASASEFMINGLKAHMNVTTVGSATYGKPVGQSRFDFCENDILRAVTFKIVNADGEGDYFDGIQPTCAATDDIFHPLGAVEEASLAEALHYLETGNCSATATKAAWELAEKNYRLRDQHPLVEDGRDILKGGAR